jgi:hypothetical protein
MLIKFLSIVIPFVKELLFDKKDILERLAEDPKKRRKRIVIFVILIVSLSLNALLFQRLLASSVSLMSAKKKVVILQELEIKNKELLEKENSCTKALLETYSKN